MPLNANNDTGARHDAIRGEAAAWFARRRDGHAAADDAFEAWRARSEAHAQAYVEVERSWQQWGRLQGSTRMRQMSAAALASTAAQRWQIRSPFWRPWALAGGLALMAVAGVGVWRVSQEGSSSSVSYATALGEQRTERLDDGSQLTLNTQTVLEVRYSRDRRDIVLQRGEAMFDVAHDAQRPFVVQAGMGTVTALGTRFQVRSEMPDAALVTLIEGKVEVAAQRQRRPMSPGEQVRYGRDGLQVRQVDPVSAASWTLGRLDFSGLPLGEAVAEANRYSPVKLRLGDPALAALPVGGSFRIGDNLAIAEAFSAVFPVRVDTRDEDEIMLMPQ